MQTTPITIKDPYTSLDSLAIFIILRRNIAYKTTNTVPPTTPSSSTTTANIKSLSCIGKKSYWFCVPLYSPFPVIPPEPMAIIDCIS